MCINPNFAFCLPKKHHPLTAVEIAKGKIDDGKPKHKLSFIKFDRKGLNDLPVADRIDIQRSMYESNLYRYDEGTEIIELKCGQCQECRMQQASQWSVRLTNELKTFPDAIFLTLTYDEDHLPLNNSLNPEHLRQFMKNLRYKYKGIKSIVMPNGDTQYPIRFWGCGEYGSKSGRAHYHLILFNIKIWDKEPDQKQPISHSGEKQYFSETLQKIWGKGRISFGSVTPESCNYVARYTLKKVNGANKEEHYSRVIIEESIDPETGELTFVESTVSIQPEFSAQTTQPGIGYFYYQQYKNDILSGDFIVQRNKKGAMNKLHVPRYYDKLTAKADERLIDDIKSKRKAKALKNDIENPLEKTGSRRAVKDIVRKAKTKSLVRNI
jgi:hypothetical protein